MIEIAELFRHGGELAGAEAVDQFHQGGLAFHGIADFDDIGQALGGRSLGPAGEGGNVLPLAVGSGPGVLAGACRLPRVT